MVTGWERWKATTTHKQHRQLGSEGSPLLVRQLGTVLGHGSLVTGYGGLAWREGHMSFCRSWGSSTEQHWSPNSRICSSCTRLDWLSSAFYQLDDFFVNLKIFCRLGDFRQLEDLLSTWRFFVNLKNFLSTWRIFCQLKDFELEELEFEDIFLLLPYVLQQAQYSSDLISWIMIHDD